MPPPRSPWDPNYGQPGAPAGPDGGGGESITPDPNAEGSGSGDGTNGQGGVYGGGGPNGAGPAPMPPPPPPDKSYGGQQAPFIGPDGYDNGPSNEFSNAADQKYADGRQAPPTYWGQANSDYGLQKTDAQSYQDVLSGKAPSLADIQMQRGLNTSAQNANDLAASSRGGGGNLLMSQLQAQRQNATASQDAISQGAMLRAGEQAQARQGLAGLSTNMRQGSQQQAQFGTQMDMQQRGLNDARYQNDAQNIQASLNERGNFDLGAQSNATAQAQQQHNTSQDQTNNVLTGVKIGLGAVTGGASAAATGGAKALSQQGVAPQQPQGLSGGDYLGQGQGGAAGGQGVLGSPGAGGGGVGGYSGNYTGAAGVGGATDPQHSGLAGVAPNMQNRAPAPAGGLSSVQPPATYGSPTPGPGAPAAKPAPPAGGLAAVDPTLATSRSRLPYQP